MAKAKTTRKQRNLPTYMGAVTPVEEPVLLPDAMASKAVDEWKAEPPVEGGPRVVAFFAQNKGKKITQAMLVQAAKIGVPGDEVRALNEHLAEKDGEDAPQYRRALPVDFS